MRNRLVGGAIAAFLLYYLFSDPAGAAHSVHQILGMLKQAGSSLATFFDSL